jgi:hypothetical protein
MSKVAQERVLFNTMKMAVLLCAGRVLCSLNVLALRSFSIYCISYNISRMSRKAVVILLGRQCKTCYTDSRTGTSLGGVLHSRIYTGYYLLVNNRLRFWMPMNIDVLKIATHSTLQDLRKSFLICQIRTL